MEEFTYYVIFAQLLRNDYPVKKSLIKPELCPGSSLVQEPGYPVFEPESPGMILAK